MVSDPQTRRLVERWQSLIAQFLLYGSGRNWSPRTLEAYADDLKRWAHCLASNNDGLDATLRATTDRFLQTLRDRNNSPKSISRRVTTVRSFGKWLARSGAFPSSPFEYLEAPRVGKRVPKFAMAEEAKGFIEACQTMRERVIITLFLRTGLRISELAHLRARDWREKTLRVIGKGNKEEIIELADATDALLHEWVASDGYRGTPSGWLLPGAKGDTHLSVSSIRAIVYKVTARAGRKLNPHGLRHSTATILLGQGVDLKTIQVIMRHSSLATTGHYAHVVSAQKRKAAEDFPV